MVAHGSAIFSLTFYSFQIWTFGIQTVLFCGFPVESDINDQYNTEIWWYVNAYTVKSSILAKFD